MKIFSNKKAIPFAQKVSITLAFVFLTEAICPSLALALTGGPSAPEFSSFEPVTTTNMVNEFSGDFSYNIPVLNIPGSNGGGYAMSLSYHAGESAESDASWVGYGWTLNPGSINRGKKGYADDTYNTRTYYNDVPANWTVSTGASIGNLEAFSFNLPLSANASIRYNNYRGFGYTAGAGLSFRQGLVSLGYSISDGSGSFSAQINPASLLTSDKKLKEIKDKQKKYYEAKTPEDKEAALAAYRKTTTKTKKESREARVLSTLGSAASNYGMYALGDQQQPTTATAYSGESFNVNFNLQTNPSPVEVGPQFGFTGNYNQQKNEPSTQRTAYGYLYSAFAYSDGGGVMDYALEKESMYNKRDRFLSIPFSSADAFSISGEGLGGGFRLHSNKPGHFRPNSVESKTRIGQVSADVCVGLEFGVGFNLGYGEQNVQVNGNDWGNGGSGNTTNYRFANREDPNVVDRNDAFFFRFNGDLGGDVDFKSDDLTAASIDQDSWVPGAQTFHPQVNNVNDTMTSRILASDNEVLRSGRSSYIGFHTNAEMAHPAYTFEKSTKILYDGTPVDRSSNPEQIAEISTVNEEGNRYVYGLPVKVKNETNLQYDVKGASAINNNFQVIKDISNYKRKIGEVDNGMYCSGYLLTQITTPDYVDLTQNGPTDDDFGGYTKFEYERVYDVAGGNGYHYRMPYNGLQYSKGDMTDPSDDMGSYSSGDRDVYYLKKIITKTHTATFNMGPRSDGLDAANDVTAANSATAKGSRTLKQLNNIVLTANGTSANPSSKIVKKVVFIYDNTLCNGVANATSGGKLKLKALWFESDGIVNVKVSPYQFKYNYPDIATTYPIKYRADFKVGYDNTILQTANQNPSYSPFAIDAWGNYQDVGATNLQRFLDMKAGVNQAPAATFDPAAWQLKVIQLPSGGEIHVQYEQDDYLYVQNRRATTLVSLLGANTLDEVANTSGVYALNVADLGITTPAEKQELVTLIKQTLTGQKVYFKFLYALVGSMQSNPINACNSDYVTGYAEFQTARVNPTTNNVEITIGDNSSNGGYFLPRKVCLDLVKKQKGGKLNEYGNCNASDAGVQNGLDTKTMVRQLINKIGTSFFNDQHSCKEIKTALSYFKIPVLKPKKGGGLRVKRILMYDANGIDYGTTATGDGTAALYGTEYFYQNEDGKGSGVATNEPATIREENALISCLAKRSDQGFLNKAVAGVDKEQFEGPIGENLLPSPSVGYARVVSKNIHSGKTSAGFIVSEFNTVKDYPFDMNYAALNAKGVDQTNIEQEKDWLNLPAIITNINVSNIWASQGYRFIVNAMHGQPKSVATYAGDFTSGTTGPITMYAKNSSTNYEYFQPGEKVNVALTADGAPRLSNPGKETEMVFEIKQVEDITADASIEIDFGVGILGIIPLPQASASPLVNYTESRMRTHVTSKVIQYPVIQKAVVSSQNGITHRTENLVFSAQTGKPIKTKTTDGYDGLILGNPGNTQNGVYTSYSTPAYSQYKEMSQKAINERYIIRPGVGKLSAVSINYVAYFNDDYLEVQSSSGSICNLLATLTKGDLIRLNEHTGAYFYISGITGNKINLLKSYFYVPGLASTAVSSIEIVKSGRTNQVNESAGQYTTYGVEQTPVIVPTDLVVKARWDNFISQLNAGLSNPGGITIPSSSHPDVTFNNEACTPLRNDIIVDPPSSNKVSVFVNYSESGCLTELYTNSASGVGHFGYNESGQILYYSGDNPCTPQIVNCFKFCTPNPSYKTITNVISASAVTYKDIWEYGRGHVFETGQWGKWRPEKSFVYNAPIIGGSNEDALERNYKNAGTFTMRFFNWKEPALNSANVWINTNTITKYSVNGDVAEERDALGIYSAARYGYNTRVPYIVAKNATYDALRYESFENMYTDGSIYFFEDGTPALQAQHVRSVTAPIAHSGIASYKLTATSGLDFQNFAPDSRLANKSLSLKVWVKDPSRLGDPLIIVLNKSGSPAMNYILEVKKIAQSGEWVLYEALTDPLELNGTYHFKFRSANATDIYIDDIRQQPVNATATAFVYDPATLRLVTSFDDQHFGLYYRYNGEGKLTSKLVETVKGMKTVTEQQYNTPLTTKP